MGISLDKIAIDAPELLDGAKAAQATLAHKNLTGLTAEVTLAIDFSFSMNPDYTNGNVQALLERVLTIATQLDDDGEIELFIFDDKTTHLGKVNLKNFRGAIKKFTEGKSMGGTKYGPAFAQIMDEFNRSGKALGGLFAKKASITTPLNKPRSKPGLVFFITDGEPQDRENAVRELVNASYRPAFFQFLSIGAQKIHFLKQLDSEVPGRWIDNANYQPAGRITDLTDEKLLDLVLTEYPDWVTEERSRGQIL